MTAFARFSDWSSLPTSERPAAIAQARQRFEMIGRELHASVQMIDSVCANEGPLGGMPFAAKDMIATGVTTASWGCVEPIEPIGKRATVIERLDRAGACLIGTAEMTELAYEPSGFNAVRGSVLNPWNFGVVPGGSSSGSAALVASGCCFAALGSDTGGSVRIPSHCCGVTGLKPTWGSLPLDGTMQLAPNLDTIGVFARSASDLALVWDVLCEQVRARSLQISAAILEDALAETDMEIAQLCRDAIKVFDIPVTSRTGFPEEADRQSLLVLQAEAARTHAVRLEDNRVDVTLRKRLAKGLQIDGNTLGEALTARDVLRDDFLANFFGSADFVFLPIMPILTPHVSQTDPASLDFDARKLYALSRFTRFINYLGLPALALPIGFDHRGMPVGLQIVGRPNSESLLIALAIAFQSKTDWHGRVPNAIASYIADKKGLAA